MPQEAPFMTANGRCVLVGLLLASVQVDDVQFDDSNNDARNVWRLKWHNSTQSTLFTVAKSHIVQSKWGHIGKGRGKKSSSWVEGQSPSREHLKGEALLIQEINFSKRRKYIKELLCKWFYYTVWYHASMILCVQCKSKKNPPCGFLKIFPKRLGKSIFYTPIIRSFLHCITNFYSNISNIDKVMPY